MSLRDDPSKSPMPKWQKLCVVTAAAIIFVIVRKLLWDASARSSSMAPNAPLAVAQHRQPNLIGGDALAPVALAVIIVALAFLLWRSGKSRDKQR
jgi:hypothetical protein